MFDFINDTEIEYTELKVGQLVRQKKGVILRHNDLLSVEILSPPMIITGIINNDIVTIGIFVDEYDKVLEIEVGKLLLHSF